MIFFLATFYEKYTFSTCIYTISMFLILFRRHVARVLFYVFVNAI